MNSLYILNGGVDGREEVERERQTRDWVREEESVGERESALGVIGSAPSTRDAMGRKKMRLRVRLVMLKS